MIIPKTNCDQCGKSLICEHCGGFKWKEAVMEDNVVSPWWFCSEKCRRKFMEKPTGGKEGGDSTWNYCKKE
jgi:hypothetical protein